MGTKCTVFSVGEADFQESAVDTVDTSLPRYDDLTSKATAGQTPMIELGVLWQALPFALGNRPAGPVAGATRAMPRAGGARETSRGIAGISRVSSASVLRSMRSTSAIVCGRSAGDLASIDMISASRAGSILPPLAALPPLA